MSAPLALVQGQPAPAVLMPGLADRLLVESVILMIEDGAPDHAIDVEALRAIAWTVRLVPMARGEAWRCRSPFATHWLPLPQPSRLVDHAAALRPAGWSYGAGVREGKPFAWTRRDERSFFEATAVTPARALLKAAMHAHRHALMALEHAA